VAKKIPEKINRYYNPNNSRTFRDGDEGSDNLANNHFQFLEFYHVPSSYFVAFKAYLENFTDDYTSKWTEHQVYGRMDPIATFERTSRKINCTFNVVASSIQEAEANMRRISLLLQMLYPSYETAEGKGAVIGLRGNNEPVSTIKGSPLFKVKFLNWISNANAPGASSAEDSGLLGYINGFSFKPDLDGGTFQVGTDLYPKYAKLDFSLNVIHEHALGWDISQTIGGAASTAMNGKGAFESTPATPAFPYGKDIQQRNKSVKNSMAAKQEKKFKELSSASKKLIGGD
tara:strand:- start:5411 stop:6271 length:861 start_codon:yes stop_codon:yes gene_type:complete